MIPSPYCAITTAFDRGLEAYRGNRFAEAESELRSALLDNPDNVEAKHVLGLTLRALGRKSEACEFLAEVVAMSPKDPECWSNYGAVLRELGRIQESLKALGAAVAIDPANPIALNNLGTALVDNGEATKGREMFEAALALRPTYADAQINLARSCFESGEIDHAKRLATSAAALSPSSAEAHNRLSFIQAACGEVDASLNSISRAHDLDPGNEQITSNLFLRALSSDTVTAAEFHGQAQIWGSRFSRHVPLATSKPASVKRIGIVSGDFRSHPVGHFLLPVLRHLSEEFEIVAYSTQPQEDPVTQRIKALCSQWHVIYRTPTDSTAIQIAEANLDVLIDLAGHTGDNRLDVLAFHPAPVQVSWLGFSGTTGLPQMDYLIADKTLVPPGHEVYYTERVLRMPHSFLCTDLNNLPDPASPEKHFTFGVFNNPSKFSKTVFELWARVLKETPGSTILFKYHYSHDRYVQRQTVARLCEHGIDPGRIFFAPFANREEHHRILASVCVALDTYPYSGATTTIDCLAAGVPVVTLAGDRYAARMSASLLTTLGASDLVTGNKEEYVKRAVELTEESRSSRDLRSMLIDSPLCDDVMFADGFSTLLKGLV